MLSLMFWSTAAHANQADDLLIQTITDVQGQLAAVLLLSTASSQARDVLERITADESPLSDQLVLLTVPPGTPPAPVLTAALSERGIACALHVTPAVSGGWQVASMGECPASARLTALDVDDTTVAAPQARSGLSEAALAAYLLEHQGALQGRMLIAAVGPDVEKMVQQLHQEHQSLDVPVTRVPVAGDLVRETQQALSLSEQDCALRVSQDDAGWSVAPFGDCVAAAPAEARQVQLQPEELLARYRAQQLQIAPFGPEEPARWDVRDGSGDTLSAPSFASLVGDQDTTAQLLSEQSSALRATSALRLGGLAITSSAFFPLINMPDSTSASEDRLWSSLFLLSTGLATVLVAPKAVAAINARQEQPANYYEREQALSLVDQYNARLLPPSLPSEVVSSAAPEGEDAAPEDAAQPQEEASP